MRNYTALQNIAAEAWQIVGTTLRGSSLAPDDDAVPEIGTAVPITERLLREIVPLTAAQQLELVQALAERRCRAATHSPASHVWTLQRKTTALCFHEMERARGRTVKLSMQDAIAKIAAITGQDETRTQNQFRFWVAQDLIPFTEKRGSGPGTRRTYGLNAVCTGAALVRLTQIGVSGDRFRGAAELISRFFANWIDEHSSGPAYLVGLAPGSRKHSLVMSSIEPEPYVPMLKDETGGAAFVIDLGGIFKLATAMIEDDFAQLDE